MKPSVKLYLNVRKALKTNGKQGAERLSFQEKSTEWHSDGKVIEKSERHADANEDLDLELLLQGHSYPKFYFRNLSF